MIFGGMSPLRDPVHVLGRDVHRADEGVERLVHAVDDLAEVAAVLARIGAGGELAVLGALISGSRRHQPVHHVDAVVQVVLDLVEVAVVVVGDLRRDVALGDPVHILGSHVQRADDGVERLVDAVDDLAEVAADACSHRRGWRACRLDCRLDQHVGVGHQRVHVVDAGVQVVLDLVEVAVVLVGDLRRDVALRDPVHVLGSHVQRADHGVERLVDAGDDLLVPALELFGVAARCEFALHGSLGQHLRFADQSAQRFHNLNERLAKRVLFGGSLHLNAHITSRDLLRQCGAILSHFGHGAEGSSQPTQFVLGVSGRPLH